MYGIRVPRSTTPIALEFWEMQEKWIDLTAPTSHPPVDLLPILKLVPERFASWKTICKDVKSRQQKIYPYLLGKVEERMASGQGNGCYMETVISKAKEYGMDHQSLL